MDQNLYEQFSAAIRSLPEADLLDTISRVDVAVDGASRDTTVDGLFTPVGDLGRADAVFRVLSGRSVAEVVDVMRRLRSELADELVKRGTPPGLIAEMRDGGPRPTSIVAGGEGVVGRETES